MFKKDIFIYNTNLPRVIYHCWGISLCSSPSKYYITDCCDHSTLNAFKTNNFDIFLTDKDAGDDDDDDEEDAKKKKTDATMATTMVPVPIPGMPMIPGMIPPFPAIPGMPGMPPAIPMFPGI